MVDLRYFVLATEYSRWRTSDSIASALVGTREQGIGNREKGKGEP
jgi:hypothetical protein